MSRRAGRSTARRGALLVAIAIVVASLLVLLGAMTWSLFLRPSVSVRAGQPVRVVIADGQGTSSIGTTLAEKGVVRSALMFRFRVRISGAEGTLRAGTYDLSTGMPYSTVIEALRMGPRAELVTVTIPEGFVLEQIAERLQRQADIPADEFLELARGGASRFSERHPYLSSAYKGSLEGYLFPKTYRIRRGAPASEAIEQMLAQFDREIQAVDTSAAEKGGMSLAELVTAASMIERETKVPAERALVSSVIRNRLARHMRLEIDATLEYVLPGNRFRLRNKDLRVDSPYNTYRNLGLPPGPIANPGLAALKAAAEPADTEYLYYVLTGKDGSHTFATNKPDFLAAKRKSKEVFGK